jgi:hypothetical protein
MLSRFKLVKKIIDYKNISSNQINKDITEKLNLLKVNSNYFDINTIKRLQLCSVDFLSDIINNFKIMGIKEKQIANMFKIHDDWSLLNKQNLNEKCQMFRELTFPSEIYLEIISKNPLLLFIDKRTLKIRLNDLKSFFTKKHIDKLIVRSPNLLTDNFDNFHYKFTYVFTLMGIEQNEMCKSNVFNYSIDYLRQRHLFLYRSGFYIKPNKKNITHIDNPKIYLIFDTDLKEYLRICTHNLFSVKDYETFCNYLKKEKFDDELLGNRIGSILEKQIIKNIRQENIEKDLI